jgi:hypothetical protein
MAARNSCTKLTWNEAKVKAGGANGKKTVKQPNFKNIDHGRVLAAKVIAKSDGRGVDDIVKDRQAARRARKDEQRSAQLQSQRDEAKELQRQVTVKPFEQAQEKLAELAIEQQAQPQQINPISSNGGGDDDSSNDLQHIAECKQLQLDELLALEAIYADTDTYLVNDACRLDDLRQLVEDWQDNDNNQALLRSIAQHPPLSFTISLTVEDPSGETELVAYVLLQVTFVPKYPLHDGATPTFHLVYFLVTDKTLVVSANKPLESLGYLNEDTLLPAFSNEAEQLLPDPCVYELASMWLTEHLFDYITINPYAPSS